MNILYAIVALAAALIGYLVGTLRAARRTEGLRVELESTRVKLTSESEQRNRTSDLLAQAEAQVRAAVESASRAALNSNSETFLKLAREVFGRDQATASASLKEREDAIKQLVEPIRAALVKQETQAQELERLRVESHGKLGGQIEGLMNVQSILQRETRNLSTALRRPEVRGRWGELTLRRVVELSGMSEHCDFAEQPEVQTGEGTLRPDLLVRMPEARDLVVDAKTPLDAYMDAIEASDDETRAAALARHARHVEQRVRELSLKSYWEQFENSPEFAVLFLPGDQFLSAALVERPDLLDNALKQSIIIATPSTLMALLKVVAYGWRNAAATENAAEIRELGQELHRRLTTFVGHLQKVGRSLDNALGAYNSAVGSFERNVTPQARRFTELGATSDVLSSIEPAEQVVRLPQAAAEPKVEPAADQTELPAEQTVATPDGGAPVESPSNS
jgi:DNA recombination protein RmuC